MPTKQNGGEIMPASELAFDIALLGNDPKARRLYYKPVDIAPIASQIPSTLLIDQDRGFVQAFARLARRFHVPFQTFASAQGLETQRTRAYDLILLDERTVGKENILEIATRLMNIHGDTSIVLIGEDEPSKKEMAELAPIIQRFLYKDWDAEALFSDAMQVFAMGKKAPDRPLHRHYGGPYGIA